MMLRSVLFLTTTCPPGRPPNDPPRSADLFGFTDATANAGRLAGDVTTCAARRGGTSAPTTMGTAGTATVMNAAAARANRLPIEAERYQICDNIASSLC